MQGIFQTVPILSHGSLARNVATQIFFDNQIQRTQ